MKYPNMKVDGKKVIINKNAFDWYKKRVKTSLTMDNQENEMGLSKKDIDLLAWNCAVMVYHEHTLPKPSDVVLTVLKKYADTWQWSLDKKGKSNLPKMLKEIDKGLLV